MLIQASKLDIYGRKILCGYGFTDLPSVPGYSKLTIPLWRPTGSVEQELDSFLLGVVPALITPEPIYDTAWKERCRLVTVSAGIVTVELYVATRFSKQHGIDEQT